MDRLARAQRGWLARRLWILGASAATAAVAAVLEGARLNLDPDGSAVHGVALLVNLIIVAILVRLTLLHLDGPSLEDSSWDRHAHRASVREAPFVALCGLMVAALLAVATPGLVAEERSPGAPLMAVNHSDHDPVPESGEPVRTPPAPAVDSLILQPMTNVDLAAKAAREKSVPTLALPSMPRAEEISNDRQLIGGRQDGEPQRRFLQDPITPLQDPEAGRMMPEPSIVETLPPVHGTVAVFLAAVSGRQEVEGATGRVGLDLESVRGTRTFEAAAEITAEFALDASNALKITYAGMQIFEKGELRQDTTFGSTTGAKGDPYEFEMVWSHLYAGLQHRIAGYTPDSWFDFSFHAGAMIDHTLARFDSDPSGVSSSAVKGERGWTAPAIGFSTAFWGPGPAGGLVLEVLQSLPVNLGGQSIAMTDLRAGFQVEVSEAVSIYLGYRHVQAAYRRFEEPLVRTGGRTSSHIEVSGPVVGVDLRF